jgi:hypothetical protein
MTTIQAFNEMMGQFLGELSSTFPEQEAVKAALEAPRDRETFDSFMKGIGPFSSQLMTKSDDFFVDSNEFAKALNLIEIWAEASPATKDAIWQFLQTMYILGNTISMFPPETLSMIEAAAENCARNMKSSNQMDEQSLMAGMNSMLSQMMSGSGPAAGLQALMGAAQPQQPRRSSKSKSKGRR